MRPPTSTHWLRENHTERSPRRLVFVDTETRPESPERPERQVLRLWSALVVRRGAIESAKPREEWRRGLTAAELVAAVNDLARADTTTWLLTHNLGFDLAVTALPVLLTESGWTLTEAALTTDQPWARLARGSRRLTIADTWSWLPAAVLELGELVGLPKLDLPPDEADEATWWARCDRDAQIIGRAYLQLLDWWDAGHFGNWSLTGPATGWSSYRHRRPAPRVLVEPDPAARELEQRAVTGGRREVRRLGTAPSGLYAELDMGTAHLVAMSEKGLPMRRLRPFESLRLDAPELRSRLIDVLAECVVRTRTPRYPFDSGHGLFYPVGTFRTVLAGPELRSALARGELVSIGRGYRYQMFTHMAPWARWLASLLDPKQSDVAPAVRLLAKHWSRCVPGKWAGRTSEVVRKTVDPRPGWHVERGVLMPGRRAADFLRIGGQLWTITRDEWAEDAFPAILAWIQSWTRLALNAALDAIGPTWLCCNTDGALVDVGAVLQRWARPDAAEASSARDQLLTLDTICDVLQVDTAPFQLRVKAAARRVVVYSPQHVTVGGVRHLAGIPRRAQRLAGGRYRFTVWPRLRVQLAREGPPAFETDSRTVPLSLVPPTGWLLADRSTVLPVRVELDAGRHVLEPFPPGVSDLADLAPPDLQHPWLRRAMGLATARPRAPRQTRSEPRRAQLPLLPL